MFSDDNSMRLIKLLSLITFWLPFLLWVGISDFHFQNVVEFFKELSIPVWIVVFSIYWIYYKKQVKDLSHFKFMDSRIEELKQQMRNGAANANEDIRSLNEGKTNLQRAERSVLGLEIALGYFSVIICSLGVIYYLINNCGTWVHFLKK